MIKTTTIAPSDYAVLNQQEIMETKGSAEEAVTSLMPGDLFSVVVNPINNIAVAIEKGKYSDVYSWINEERVPLQEITGAKRVYFVPVTENIHFGEEEVYVNKFGLTLCAYGPNYLVGAMAVLCEDQIPPELKGKNFVAAENETSPVFYGKKGCRCSLLVFRSGGKRELQLLYLKRHLGGNRNWMLLAEKPQAVCF